MENKHDEDYGLHDPDFIDQQTPAATNLNYSPDDDQFQYQEEFIEDDEHPSVHSDRDGLRAENIPDKERIVNEDNNITNDDRENDLNSNDNPDDLDYENDLEKDGDLDNDEELSDFDAEHYPDNHPRE